MPFVLTTASTVQCAHGGTVALKASQTRLTVDGNPALGPLDLVGAPIASCSVPATPGSAPCLTVASVVAGPAATLLVAGAPVLLDTATGLTNGIPQPATWRVIRAGQAKLGGR